MGRATPGSGRVAGSCSIGIGEALGEFLEAGAFFGGCVFEHLLGAVAHAAGGFALLLGILALTREIAEVLREFLHAAIGAGIGAGI